VIRVEIFLLKDEELFYYYLFTRAEYEISLATSNYETDNIKL